MKKVLLFTLITVSIGLSAQNIGIGTNTPSNKAKLEISSDTTGVLIPRITTAQRNTMSTVTASMPNGLLVYDTDLDRFMYWDESLDGGGGSWIEITSAEDSNMDWFLENTLTPPNSIDQSIYTNGDVGIGISIPASILHLNRNTAEVDIHYTNENTTWQVGTNNAGNGTDNNQFYIFDNTYRFTVQKGSGNVGIGTSNPGRALEVNGDIVIPNSTGSKSIYTWTNNDENWRFGMNNADASVGFTRALATSHVQYSTYASGSGQGFAVGDNVSGLSSFEVTGSGNSYQSYFRGNVGIGTATTSNQLTLGGTANVFGVENAAYFQAKNSGGTYENYFWPRWSDDIMYMNYGAGGMDLRNNASETAMFIDNDRSIDIRKGVLFNCDDCGSQSTIDGTENWGDLVIQGRVLSANSNLHLSPPNGNSVVINTAYRAAGGAAGTANLIVDEGRVYVNDAGSTLNRSALAHDITGLFDGAAGFNFSQRGVVISSDEGESGGFQGNGNNANIWSPGDADLVRFYDEDGMNLRSYINGATGAYTVASDIRKKQNIIHLENALSKIIQLNGYSYEFKLHQEEIGKGDTPVKTSGVIVQEVQELMPELVDDHNEDGLFMNYSGLIPYLIEAIKEQQIQIEQLKLLLSK